MPSHLLIIGDLDDPEFIGLSEFVGELKGVSFDQVRRLSDLTHHDSSIPELDAPELIVVLERHPDEYSPLEVQRLIESHPLARIVCGFGPWSESAARTRGAWPPAAWVPVAVLPERIVAELAVIRGERPPLPITADRADSFEERYASSSGDVLDARTDWQSLHMAVDSPDAEYRLMLEDELSLLSIPIVGGEDAWDILLFDAHPEPHRFRELRRLLDTHSQRKVTVIVLHELPSAVARAQWSQTELRTDAPVRVVSKLAPLSSLLSINCWPSGNDSATS